MPWTKILADAYGKAGQPRPAKKGRQVTYREAIREALYQALEIDKRVIIMGEDVDGPTGVFGTTRGLHEKFGRERVINTPLSENGFTGIANGAAIAGLRPVIVHARMDFMVLSMDQIANHAAQWRYMFGGKQSVPITIQGIIGRGWGSAAQHSQSLQSLFLHVPGLRLVMPSNAYDAKGLLLASIASDDPVIFIEHRWLHNQAEHVPEKMYIIPMGKGAVKKEGRDVTVIATSIMVLEAMEAAGQLFKEGIDIEVIDLRSIKPMDEVMILNSLKKTGRLVVADAGWKTGGVAAEIMALVCEKAFSYLRAPISRVTLPDTPTPASPVLEKAFYPGAAEIKESVKKVLDYGCQHE